MSVYLYVSVCLLVYLFILVSLFVFDSIFVSLSPSLVISLFNFFLSYFPPHLPSLSPAFVFWNDDRRNNSATDSDPFGMEEFPSVGFPSQTCMEQFVTEKEQPFGTLSKDDRDIRMDDMEK